MISCETDELSASVIAILSQKCIAGALQKSHHTQQVHGPRGVPDLLQADELFIYPDPEFWEKLGQGPENCLVWDR